MKLSSNHPISIVYSSFLLFFYTTAFSLPNLNSNEIKIAAGNYNPPKKTRSPTSKKLPEKKISFTSLPSLTMGWSGNIGMHYYGTGYGGESWLSLRDTHCSGVSLTKVTTSLDSITTSENYKEKLYISFTQATAFYRYFLLPTFYLNIALGINKISGKYGFQVTGSTNSYINYQYSFLSSGVSIGNQWRFWPGILFGIDWIGYSLANSPKIQTNETDSSEEVSTFKDRLLYHSDQSGTDIIDMNLKKNFGLHYATIRIGYQL